MIYHFVFLSLLVHSRISKQQQKQDRYNSRLKHISSAYFYNSTRAVRTRKIVKQRRTLVFLNMFCTYITINAHLLTLCFVVLRLGMACVLFVSLFCVYYFSYISYKNKISLKKIVSWYIFNECRISSNDPEINDLVTLKKFYFTCLINHWQRFWNMRRNILFPNLTEVELSKNQSEWKNKSISK